jgi:hypothetical protein
MLNRSLLILVLLRLLTRILLAADASEQPQEQVWVYEKL